MAATHYLLHVWDAQLLVQVVLHHSTLRLDLNPGYPAELETSLLISSMVTGAREEKQ